MTEGLAYEPEEEKPDEPAGWQVTGPDGNVVAAGGQAVTDASAGAGEET